MEVTPIVPSAPMYLWLLSSLGSQPWEGSCQELGVKKGNRVVLVSWEEVWTGAAFAGETGSPELVACSEDASVLWAFECPPWNAQTPSSDVFIYSEELQAFAKLCVRKKSRWGCSQVTFVTHLPFHGQRLKFLNVWEGLSLYLGSILCFLDGPVSLLVPAERRREPPGASEVIQQ